MCCIVSQLCVLHITYLDQYSISLVVSSSDARTRHLISASHALVFIIKEPSNFTNTTSNNDLSTCLSAFVLVQFTSSREINENVAGCALLKLCFSGNTFPTLSPKNVTQSGKRSQLEDAVQKFQFSYCVRYVEHKF